MPGPSINNASPNVSRVYNLIVLDESGSMESIKHATINGFNELIQSIRQSEKDAPDIKQFINFYSFNGAGIKEILTLCEAGNAKELTSDTYQPDNMTPLYDAIGYSVNALKKSIENEKDYTVLVTILTDGEENASKEYTHEAVAALINNCKKEGWLFTYVGANHNVEKTAFALNIHNHLHFESTVQDTDRMFKKYSSSRDRYMDKLKSKKDHLNDDFFDEDESKN